MNSHSIPLSSGRTHGAAEGLRGLLAAAFHYVEARMRLLWLEGQHVVQRGLLFIILSIIAIIGTILTYLGGMIALVLWIAHTWWDGNAIPAVLIVALGHLLLAVGCIAWVIHAARRSRFFHATLKEFKEDRQWLHENQTSSN